MYKMRLIIIAVFYLVNYCNRLEAGFLTSYPATAGTTANLGVSTVGTVGTTILQDSYSVPPYTSGAAGVETIGYDYAAPAAPAVPVVEKKIYVHVPPQAAEQSLQYGPPAPPPRKHYKIIFVKAPSPPSQPPIAPQVEEKTLVYVLVKKPEPPTVHEVQNNVKPSKPEVYFINYKTQKENVGSSSQAVSGGGSSGGGLSSGIFTGSLGNGGGGSLGGGNDNIGGFAGLGNALSTAVGGGGGAFGGSSSSGNFGDSSLNSLSSPSSDYLPPSPSSTYLPPSPPSSYLPPNK